jgi:CRP-like cAMP-binding protein
VKKRYICKGDMKQKKIICEFCGLYREGVFCGMSEKLRNHLNDEKSIQTFERGQVLFYQNSPSFAIFCVHTGRVKLYKTGNQGERYVIRLLGAGEILGYRAVLSGEPYAASAEAVEKTTACLIPRELLHQLLQDSPELASNMMLKLAVELRISEEQMLSIINHPVRQRTADLLINLAQSDTEHQPGKNLAIGSLRRGEMAQMIGTTPETFSRTLHELAREGLIEVSSRAISIVDYSGLEKIARK